MKILFDQGTPAPLRQSLPEHSIDTAFDRGWASLTNGDLLSAAEQERYDVLITTDQNLRYQQDLNRRQIAVVVLLSTSWPRIRKQIESIRNQLKQVTKNSYHEIEIP